MGEQPAPPVLSAWRRGRGAPRRARSQAVLGMVTRGGLCSGDPGRPALTPQEAWGDLALSGRCRPLPGALGTAPALSLCWTPRARRCGRENGPRGGPLPARPQGAGARGPHRESGAPPSAFDGSGPTAGPTWVSRTQESLTRDRVLSVLSGGCSPDAAPARGPPLWMHHPEALTSAQKRERSLPRCSAAEASGSPGSCCRGGRRSRPPARCAPPSGPRAEPPPRTG